jgi:uncharacterized protein YkwD
MHDYAQITSDWDRTMTQTIAMPAQQRVFAALTALALTLAAFLAGAVNAAPASASVSAESTFVSKINSARSARGVQRLNVRSDLVSVARAQAARMASRNVLYHNPNLTRDVRNWRWVGENVGYGPSSATVHVAFMNSPAHKANIVDRDYTEVGVGAVVRGGRVWVAEVFRKPAKTAVQGTKHTAVRSSAHPTLRFGSNGPAVKRVQRRLGVRPTGYFGPVTRAAVKRFQGGKGWRRTGVVGPKTWRALGL